MMHKLGRTLQLCPRIGKNTRRAVSTYADLSEEHRMIFETARQVCNSPKIETNNQKKVAFFYFITKLLARSFLIVRRDWIDAHSRRHGQTSSFSSNCCTKGQTFCLSYYNLCRPKQQWSDNNNRITHVTSTSLWISLVIWVWWESVSRQSMVVQEWILFHTLSQWRRRVFFLVSLKHRNWFEELLFATTKTIHIYSWLTHSLIFCNNFRFPGDVLARVSLCQPIIHFTALQWTSKP